MSNIPNSSSAKLCFEPSLNVVDKAFATRAGEILAENPIGSASYARLQRQGTNVLFVNDPTMVEMGVFDRHRNSVTVNMFHHSSAKDAASTVVHEATHQNGFFKGMPQNTHKLSIRHFAMNYSSKRDRDPLWKSGSRYGTIFKNYIHTCRKVSIRLEV
jgi:hypothetical protein